MELLSLLGQALSHLRIMREGERQPETQIDRGTDVAGDREAFRERERRKRNRGTERERKDGQRKPTRHTKETQREKIQRWQEEGKEAGREEQGERQKAKTLTSQK